MTLADIILKYNLIPEKLLRKIIRYQCRLRLAEESAHIKQDPQYHNKLLKQLSNSKIALSTEQANHQHYTVPNDFYRYVLGKNLKYSCCYWDSGTSTLDQAEQNMIELVIQRAKLADGQQILELGCGWGSLCLKLARDYPNSKITAISNSTTQKQFLDERIKREQLTNLNIIIIDINNFDTTLQFDRIISIEMFEHIRNYQLLMRNIARWLKKDGLCFVHHFCNQSLLYEFNQNQSNSWMAKNFFTDGLMPAYDTLDYFSHDLIKKEQWLINGIHYQKTSEAWLKNLKNNRLEIFKIFQSHYKNQSSQLIFQYWRVFFLACSELFGYDDGKQWNVKHILFSKRN